jgi:hypothetical protein
MTDKRRMTLQELMEAPVPVSLINEPIDYEVDFVVKETATQSNAGETMTETDIESDLKQRSLRNNQREKMMKLVERWVFDLKIDWNEFIERLADATELSEEGGQLKWRCDHTTTNAERIIAEMGLDKEAIDICLLYFDAAGGHCDCEIVFNVDMTDPRPLSIERCHDCGSDFDEYSYVVHDAVWNASGLSDGLLCIGCLEARIGRRLCRDDFTDAALNRFTDSQSLRLQDRING